MQVVNEIKKDDEPPRLFVLSFWYGSNFRIMGQEVPHLQLSMMSIMFIMIVWSLLGTLSWVIMVQVFIFKGHETFNHTLSRSLHIVAFTFTFNHLRCYDRGNESFDINGTI